MPGSFTVENDLIVNLVPGSHTFARMSNMVGYKNMNKTYQSMFIPSSSLCCYSMLPSEFISKHGIEEDRLEQLFEIVPMHMRPCNTVDDLVA